MTMVLTKRGKFKHGDRDAQEEHHMRTRQRSERWSCKPTKAKAMTRSSGEAKTDSVQRLRGARRHLDFRNLVSRTVTPCMLVVFRSQLAAA